MIGDDLVSLLAPPPPSGVGFRQGVVLSWNSNTGENTINVGGARLTNVPILNTGEAIALKAGHIVALLAAGPTWFIVGRITVPGAGGFASASVAFAGAGASSAAAFGLTTTPTLKVTSSIAVPAWADEAMVIAASDCSIYNSSATARYITTNTVIAGIGGGGATFGIRETAASTNNTASGATSAQRFISAPGPSISVGCQVWVSSGTIPSDALNIANINAIAVFRSTV